MFLYNNLIISGGVINLSPGLKISSQNYYSSCSKNYYSVCIGEVGAGKSSFINSVLKYGNKYSENNCCKAASHWKGVTKELDTKYIDDENDKFYFIDTPGLNEANVDEENKKLLRKELSGNPKNMSRLRCILIIMKIMDYRFTAGIQQIIIELMNCFPSPNFWDHVLVIRTHCFEPELINNIKGNFEEIIKNDIKIREIMKNKNIKLPKEFKEFYVNSKDKHNNIISDKIGDIINAIRKIPPLYDNIQYSDIQKRKEGNIMVIYKIMTFQDFGNSKKHQVEIIIDTEGAEETIRQKVGEPFSKTCQKGKWQKYQRYQVTYEKDGKTIKNKVSYGPEFDERI